MLQRKDVAERGYCPHFAGKTTETQENYVLHLRIHCGRT